MPYVVVVSFDPVTLDAVRWISESSHSNEALFEWIFQTRHFRVGYRPVAALSYLASEFFPDRVLALRVFSLVLFAGVLLLLMSLGRTLFQGVLGAGRTTVIVVLTPVFLALHLATFEVVLFLARLNYLLSAFFGLLALSILCKREFCRNRPLLTGMLVSVLFVLSFFSNESGVLFAAAGVLLYVIVDAFRKIPWKTRFLLFAPQAVFLLFALFLRSSVVSGVGGYSQSGFSLDEAFSIFSRIALTFFQRGFSFGEFWASALFCGGAVAIAVWMLRKRDSCRQTLLFLTTWVFAGIFLFSVLGVWFVRQMFFIILPLSLLLASLLVVLVTEKKERSGFWVVQNIKRLSALLLFSLIIGSYSAVLGGNHPQDSFIERARHLTALYEDFQSGAPESGVVQVVLRRCERHGQSLSIKSREHVSDFPRTLRAPYEWLLYLSRGRERQLLSPVLIDCESDLTSASLVVRDGRALLLAKRAEKVVLGSRVREFFGETPLGERGIEPALVFYETKNGGEWVDFLSIR